MSAMLDRSSILYYALTMNQLPLQRRAQVLGCLVEGMSIRATVRLTGVAKNTVVKLLADVGAACMVYQDSVMRDLPCKRVQVDEIWAFCYAKEKNVPKDRKGVFGYGDTWTWTAICADTKLVPCWMVGPRQASIARQFIDDLAARLSNRVQLTSDGYKPYLKAVEKSFGNDVDYAMLVKIYGETNLSKGADKKYSPGSFVSATPTPITGDPDPKHISTSYVERQNLTMRMSMRRFTRLTNGFSKKVENLMFAVALHFMYYNFGRIHKTLRVSPAMEAGISDHIWSLEEIAGLTEKYAKTA
jgi:IS1 family transposase